MTSFSSASNPNPFFECDNCGCNFSCITNNQYDVDDNIWCEKCYTKQYYPDEYNNKYIDNNDNNDKCDFCNTLINDDTNEGDNCGHIFCNDCFENIAKYNKCPTCFETITDDQEPNKEICKSCYREYCDCICYVDFKNNKCDYDEIFNIALFIKYKNTINHKIIRKVIDMFRINYGFKFLNIDEVDFEDIKIKKSNEDNHFLYLDNEYELTIPNIKYNPNKSICSSNKYEHSIILEHYTESELSDKTKEYIRENIHYFNHQIIFDCIKDDVYKYEIDSEDISEEEEEEEPEKIYDNESCPVCLEEYNDNKRIGCCGHIVCQSCYDHITDSNNSRCPECREDWTITHHINSEKVEFELDDIRELCDSENYETLNQIINIDELCDRVVSVDGYADILGYDDYDNIYDTNFKGEDECDLYILVRGN